MPNKEIMALHHSSFIVDGHADTFWRIASAVPLRITNRNQALKGKSSAKYRFFHDAPDFFQGTPPTRPGKIAKSHVDFQRLKQGGTNLQFMAIYSPPKYTGLDATTFALKMLFEILNAIRESNHRLHRLTLIKSAADLNNAIKNDSLSFLINIEGGNPLNKDLGLLRMFYDMGVRALGLTHNPYNDLGDGIGVKRPKGLTPFGKSVVREMNRLGMLIDCAHLAKPGFKDVARIARGPFISSHTGVRALRDIPRNLDDEQIREIARRKGVMGVFYLPDYLKKFTKKKDSATVKDVVNHIQYIADKFGVDYVGLGSDWDGYGGVTYGLEDCSYLPNITAELVHRGFNQTEIRKILGGNFVRVIKQILR